MIQNTNSAIVSNCTFEHNDAGPILSTLQVVGLEDKERASAIFVGDKNDFVKITDCTFNNNTLDFMVALVKESN